MHKDKTRAKSSYGTCNEAGRAKSSYGTGSCKILRINRLLEKENQRLNAQSGPRIRFELKIETLIHKILLYIKFQ